MLTCGILRGQRGQRKQVGQSAARSQRRAWRQWLVQHVWVECAVSYREDLNRKVSLGAWLACVATAQPWAPTWET